MEDFSREQPLGTYPFTMDGDEFHAVSEAPGMSILSVAKINEAKDLGKIEILMEFLDQVLLPESAERFAERLRSPENPISIQQCAKVAVHLVEKVYVPERPTRGPSPSANGSASTGPSSTGGAQPTGTTPGGTSQRVL